MAYASKKGREKKDKEVLSGTIKPGSPFAGTPYGYSYHTPPESLLHTTNGSGYREIHPEGGYWVPPTPPGYVPCPETPLGVQVLWAENER